MTEKEIHDRIQDSEEMKNLHERIHSLNRMRDLKDYIGDLLKENNLNKEFEVKVTISVKLLSADEENDVALNDEKEEDV